MRNVARLIFSVAPLLFSGFALSSAEAEASPSIKVNFKQNLTTRATGRLALRTTIASDGQMVAQAIRTGKLKLKIGPLTINRTFARGQINSRSVRARILNQNSLNIDLTRLNVVELLRLKNTNANNVASQVPASLTIEGKDRTLFSASGKLVYRYSSTKNVRASGNGEIRVVFQPNSTQLAFDFSSSQNGFSLQFTGDTPETAPANVRTEVTPSGLLLSFENRSGGLTALLSRTLSEGLAPNTSYAINYKLTFVSTTPSECMGIGGSPGESTFLLFGIADSSAKLGNIANGLECSSENLAGHAPVTMVRSGVLPNNVRSDNNGELPATIALTTGFEGLTSVTIQELVITLTPIQ